MKDERCFNCGNSEKVFINTAREMIGGDYKCKFTKHIHNGRSHCTVPFNEKRLYNGVRHLNCKHCDNEKEYCNYHNKPIMDIANGETCIHHIFDRERI